MFVIINDRLSFFSSIKFKFKCRNYPISNNSFKDCFFLIVVLFPSSLLDEEDDVSMLKWS